MLLKKITSIHEIVLFRACFGLYLIYYNLSLSPDLLGYFGSSGMFRPDLYYFLQPSLLFVAWNPFGVWLLFIAMMVLILLFTMGFCPRYLVFVLWILQVSFHNANPLIIHEPQQLANLFLVFFFFFPLKNKVKKEDAENFRPLVNMLVFFLGVYYFMAGLKKLPDPLWRQGEGLSYVLQWGALGRDNFIDHLITGSAVISRLLNYAALIFEMSFIFLVFTRFRALLVPVAYLFQLGIFLTLDVGSFPFIMIAWQALLLDPQTRLKCRIGF